MSIAILNVNKYKLSYMEGFTSALVTFESDVDITAWRVIKGGSSYDTGDLLTDDVKDWSNLSDQNWNDIDDQSWNEVLKIDAEVDLTAQVNADDLNLGENTINVYGKAVNGEWSLREG